MIKKHEALTRCAHTTEWLTVDQVCERTHVGRTWLYQQWAAGAGPRHSLRTEGVMFALVGTADAATLRGWFERLSEGGRIVDDLQQRPWGGWDGQVVDRFGMHWLIGFEPE